MNATKTSASDVANRKPVSEKASADGTGHNGKAAAAVLIKAVETYAEQVASVLNKGEKTLKGFLKDLFKLSADDHVAYRNTLQAEVDKLNKEAEDAKLTMTQYRESDKRVNVIYVTLSEWKRISVAVQGGYKPDTNNPWAEIKKGATEYNNSQTAKAEQAKLAEQAKKIAADLEKPDLDEKDAKVGRAQLALIQAQMEAGPVRTGTQAPAKAKTLVQLIEGLVKDRPIQELEDAIVWLGQYIVKQYKPGERVVNTALKAVEEARKSGVPAPVTVGEHAANDRHEKAAARQPKRSAKGSRK